LIDLTNFRKCIIDMFSAYMKNKKKTKAGVNQTTYRFLGILAADIAYLRIQKKQPSDDFAEKVFSALF